MAAPAYTYSLTNGTTADASQVMQDFNDILNGVTDGTKDLTMSALTANGAANLKAAVTLGASSSNDLTVNGALATAIAIKTNNSFAVGSATRGLSGLFLGNAGVGATCQILSASHATTRNYSFPDAGAAANVVLSEGTATINGTKTFAGQLIGKGTATNDAAAAGYSGEYLTQSRLRSASTALSSGITSNVTASALSLTAGEWWVWGSVLFVTSGTNVITFYEAAISATSGTLSGADTRSVMDASGQIIICNTLPSSSVVNDLSLNIPMSRVSLTGTTSYYLLANASWTTSTMSVAGSISALRIR